MRCGRYGAHCCAGRTCATASEIDFDPGCEIIGRIRRRKADVGNITGAIASRDVQAATKRNGQMSVVAAHPATLGVCFRRRSGRARMLVTEADVLMNEVADRLHPRPTRRRVAEQPPSLVGQAIGLAVTAPSKKSMTSAGRSSTWCCTAFRSTGPKCPVTNNGVRAEAEMAGGRNQPGTPIAEAVAVTFNGNRRVRYQIIRTLQVGGA